MRERCTWCFRPQAVGEPLNITIMACTCAEHCDDDEQSPALCDDCTDAWTDGARKYSHMRRRRPMIRPLSR